MATLTIRNLSDDVRDRLRVAAARNGRSMEAEVRDVLAKSVGAKPETDRDTEWRAAVLRAQAVCAPYRDPDLSGADELIAERRVEARREDAEADEWLDRTRRNAGA